MKRLPERTRSDPYEDGSIPMSHSGWTQLCENPSWPCLTRDIDTDVVVIGAGLAGSSTALHLAERGVDVVVLEASQPGSGASGRNAGHVQPFLQLLKPMKSWPDRGKALLDLVVSNRDIVFDLARRHDIQADCARTGMLEASFYSQESFDRKAKRWKGFGYDVEAVGSGQLLELLGTNRYKHGVYWKEGGRINPYLFTNGMIEAAHRHGAKVFGDSPVHACERESLRWRVRTDEGSVLAKKVIICTSGHQGSGFFPHLGRTQFPLVACAMATTPLSPSLMSEMNPSRVSFTQSPLNLYPLVVDENNRLITATIPYPRRAGDGAGYFDSFLRYLHRTWPVAREARIEMSSYWTGMNACSSPAYHADYPKLYRVADDVLAFMNLGTWGNFMGPLLGMNLAHAIADERPQDLVLPLENPEPVLFRRYFELKIRYLLIPLARLADRFQLA